MNKSGKQAMEGKQEINETNSSQKTARKGETHQGSVLHIHVFYWLCKNNSYIVFKTELISGQISAHAAVKKIHD